MARFTPTQILRRNQRFKVIEETIDIRETDEFQNTRMAVLAVFVEDVPMTYGAIKRACPMEDYLLGLALDDLATTRHITQDTNHPQLTKYLLGCTRIPKTFEDISLSPKQDLHVFNPPILPDFYE